MKRYLFPLPDGRFLEVYQNKITSAIPFIEKRLSYSIPVDCVDVDEVKKVISYIRVNVNRDCTADEVNGIVNSIKKLMLDALEAMPKHERYISGKGDIK